MLAVKAFAVPPEGLEAFTVLSSRKGPSRLLYVQGGYDKPSWSQGYETLEVYTTKETPSKNYFTYGASVTTGSVFADRDAYFARWDQTFGGNSISLKFAHQDLRYIPAGKNIGSLDYNTGFKIGTAVDFYAALGLYYRFNLNRWNTPTWSPINTNTDDRDSFFEFCFGTRLPMGSVNFATIDLNNRDVYLPYNGDDIAADITLNFVTKTNLIFRLTVSNRFSGLLVGTADVGEQRFLLGFVTGL